MLERYCPAAHRVHGVPASPAGHGWQDALPLPGVFWPTPHARQTVASGSAAKVFRGHTAHARWPSRLLARPGMHGRHDAEASSGCENPAGHARHVDAGSLPPRNCPPAHTAHSAWFGRLLARPGMHGRHDAKPWRG